MQLRQVAYRYQLYVSVYNPDPKVRRSVQLMVGSIRIFRPSVPAGIEQSIRDAVSRFIPDEAKREGKVASELAELKQKIAEIMKGVKAQDDAISIRVLEGSLRKAADAMESGTLITRKAATAIYKQIDRLSAIMRKKGLARKTTKSRVNAPKTKRVVH